MPANVPGTLCDTSTNFENDWDQAVNQMTHECVCVNKCISMTCEIAKFVTHGSFISHTQTALL